MEFSTRQVCKSFRQDVGDLLLWLTSMDCGRFILRERESLRKRIQSQLDIYAIECIHDVQPIENEIRITLSTWEHVLPIES